MVEAYLVTTLSLEHMIRVLQMLPFPACFPRCSIVLSAVKGIMEMSDNDSVRATRVEDEIFRRGPAPSIAVWSNNRERVVTCSRMPSLIKCGGRLENTAIRFNCISPSTVNSNPHHGLHGRLAATNLTMPPSCRPKTRTAMYPYVSVHHSPCFINQAFSHNQTQVVASYQLSYRALWFENGASNETARGAPEIPHGCLAPRSLPPSFAVLQNKPCCVHYHPRGP